jgi:DNA polymerase bacteriophage-type
MPTKITFDLETRSEAELTSVGAWNYSLHESTRVLCLCYNVEAYKNGELVLDRDAIWLPPEELVRYQFNCASQHKGLMGHWHASKGNLVRISAKRLGALLAARRQHKLNECSLAKERRHVSKGFKFEGFLTKPPLTKMRLESKPRLLCRALASDEYVIEAHNVFFEKSLYWNVLQPRYGFPDIDETRWRCSAALAASYGLPRALDKVGEILELPVQKNLDGKLVMQQLAKPIKKDGEFAGWYNDPQRFTTLYYYCMDDVRAEKEISKALEPLSLGELAVWQLNQKINKKGVPLDKDIVTGAISIIEGYTRELEARMAKLTDGRLNNIRQTAQLKLWLEENGILTDSVDKPSVEKILSRKRLPDAVRSVLEIRQKLGQTSTAKYPKMLAQLCPDGTIKDQYMYHGAISGRETSRGVQVANLPRGSLKQTQEMLDTIKFGSWRALSEYGDPMDVLSSCLRGTIAAPEGYKFLVSDYSNIEGRLTAWVAGEQWKLDAFKANDDGTGPDLYKVAYARAFGIEPEEVTGDQRQLGKIMELSCGFSGWVGAWQVMAKAYNIELKDDTVKDLIIKWRNQHPKLVSFWDELETAAKTAIITGEEQIVNDKVAFDVKGPFLRCRLPSGKYIHYYKPQLVDQETPWGEKKKSISYLASKGNGAPFRNVLWRGVFVENWAQSTAREILVGAMLTLEEQGHDIRMSVYDEIVSLVPCTSELTLRRFCDTMSIVPSWAKGLPLVAEGFECRNYSKN